MTDDELKQAMKDQAQRDASRRKLRRFRVFYWILCTCGAGMLYVFLVSASSGSDSGISRPLLLSPAEHPAAALFVFCAYVIALSICYFEGEGDL